MAGRPRDEAARQTILRRAADIASERGLEGLSIGGLATDLGVSKSGLFGFFGSKEELQLATIRRARDVYLDEVVRPALAVRPGLERVRALCEHWLNYSQRRVFPGGCFFFAVTAEFDARPGRVRDAVAVAGLEWRRLVARAVEDARQLGDLDVDADADQLAFELIAFLETANAFSVLHDDLAEPYERCRTAIRARLATA
ncbi:TetR/AcrR family transcriptional regulator [Lentzea kentuckyensis]|uniref:TetR/AcrR family transcriptional regulator n=1 Tax=Lentzea kentuckyensis TaxID=360086 RepID=UPI000A35EAEC|nr:TetR/AcrR family transcriptional regulator [Lentzea kentuckyensis]